MVVSVIDANVLVSAIFGGAPLECVKQAFRNQVYYTKSVENELLGLPDKLAGKLSVEDILRFRHYVRVLLSHGREVKVTRRIRCCRDPKDNTYLEACLSAKANFLITGDRDLLDLERNVLGSVGLKKLHIVTPQQFLIGLCT